MNSSGRAAGRTRYELCFATTHTEQECAQSSGAEPEVGDHLRSLEAAVREMNRVTTPLQSSEWDRALESHPDQRFRKYIVERA